MKDLIRKLGKKLENKRNKIRAIINVIAINVITMPTYVYAGNVDADAAWNTTMEFIVKWVPRLGGVLLFIGALEFAIANKNEDANSKTNAVRLMVSGAIVMAVPLSLKSLLMV